jgi:hypothetical protein
MGISSGVVQNASNNVGNESTRGCREPQPNGEGMDRQKMIDIFEAFFEKYKKTEGDRTSWSAHWTEQMSSKASVEINMTKCPAGTIFKVFKNGSKLGEINGWDAFFEDINKMLGSDWDPNVFFGSMQDMT